MAVHQDPGTLRDAVACMRGQSIVTSRDWRLAIWLVCNGADAVTREAVAGLAAEAGRDGGVLGDGVLGDGVLGGRGVRGRGVEIIVRELEKASLAAALNVVLRESNAELVARMDADDRCPLDRLERQVAAMEGRSDAIACFGAWETRDASDATVRRFEAIEDARLVPWLLLIANPFAHGSAVMRREAVLAAGGYDETFPRAQDYDLWLRLSGRGAIISTPHTVYFHRVRHAGQGIESARLQAVHAARARMGAMARLSSLREVHGAGADAAMAGLNEVMADVAMGAAFADDERALVARLIEATGPVPTREGVDAMLWARGVARARSDEADRACFEACVREKWREMREAGVEAVALYGAGRHTLRVLAVLASMERLAPRIAGVVDDHVRGRVGVFTIQRPEDLKAGEAVLISSDVHEGAMWSRSALLRERGMQVFRLYGAGC